MAAAMAAATLCGSARQLPEPQTTGGKPLMEAIAERHSSRDIDPASQVTSQELSNMLWAAWGMTHDGGKRTVATALNRQELKLYVITAGEIELYDAASNILATVATGDYRHLAGKQDFAKGAPVNIAFVADGAKQDRAEFQAYAAGAASQDVYLYCAQAGLKTVVRASFDADALGKAMKLGPSERVLLVQTVGR